MVLFICYNRILKVPVNMFHNVHRLAHDRPLTYFLGFMSASETFQKTIVDLVSSISCLWRSFNQSWRPRAASCWRRWRRQGRKRWLEILLYQKPQIVLKSGHSVPRVNHITVFSHKGFHHFYCFQTLSVISYFPLPYSRDFVVSPVSIHLNTESV